MRSDEEGASEVGAFERRWSRATVLAAAAIFLSLIALVPAFYPSFDEAKYVGIGYQFLAGHGPRTVFGQIFLPHSPLWSAIVDAPDVWFGIDPLSWGHTLNALAGAVVIVTVAALGWRIRPAVGALAAVGVLALTYFADLTRTARLDVPVAALLLVYLWVGLRAVRTGRTRWGIATGVTFAIAFLVKEVALPMAAVPFILGLIERRPWTWIARSAAITGLIGAIGTAPWFLYYASVTGHVYRLGSPSWTLAPLTALLACGVAVGLAAEPLARRRSAAREPGPTTPGPSSSGAAATAPGSPASGPRRIAGRPIPALDSGLLGWAAAFAWFGALVVFFDHVSDLGGAGLFQPHQYELYLTTWLPGLAVVGALGVLGVLFGAIVYVTGTPATREALRVPFVGLLCTAPLIMLVIAVGEPPRNYLAQFGLGSIVVATGWWNALRWTWRRLRDGSGTVALTGLGAALGLVAGSASAALLSGHSVVLTGLVGLILGAATGVVGGRLVGPGIARPGSSRVGSARVPRVGLAAVLIVALIGGGAIMAVHVERTRESAGQRASAASVQLATAWIKASIPAGTALGFGSMDAYQMALGLRGLYPMTQIHQVLTIFDPSAPLGLTLPGSPPADDWIALDASRRAFQVYAFDGSAFVRSLLAHKIAYYIYSAAASASVPALVAALTRDHGFTPVASWSFPVTTTAGVARPTTVNVFRLDPSHLSFAGSPVFASEEAIAQLAGLLGANPTKGAAAAANLAARLRAVPATPAAAQLIEKIRQIGGS